jgi:ATP-binding cassette subfamily F protein uup
MEGEGVINEYPGGYDDWLSQRQEPEKAKPDKIKAKKEPAKIKEPIVQRKLTYKEQKELDALPLKIEKLEEEQKNLYTMFADLSFYEKSPEEISKHKSRSVSLSEELEQAYSRWDYLAELAE